MQRYILAPEDVPLTLYRVQSILYYVPPCASTKKGIYALNSNPTEPLGTTSLKDDVDNHLSIAKHWVSREESQWPSPFLSVFATQRDALAAAKGQRGMLEEGQWLCIEISGAEIRARRVKVLRAKDVKGEIEPFENQLLIWRFIPQETIVTARMLTVHEDGATKWQSLSQSQTSEGQSASQTHSQVTQVPEGFHKVKAVLDHWPEKSGITNAKMYQVRWEGNFEDDWCDADDVTEEAVDKYWEDREAQKKRQRESKSKRK